MVMWASRFPIIKISKSRKSDSRYRKAKYRGRKISKSPNTDGAKNRNYKIKNCKIFNRKISNMHNIESKDIKYDGQNIEIKKSKGQNAEKQTI